MNIATVGPAGYRFQDLVCIELALRFANKPKLSMLIESSEDALICFEEQGVKKTVEVQVKQSTADLGLEEFSGILAHFSAHSTSDFLLKRVAACDDRYSLNVVGGRGLDALRPYLALSEWQCSEHKNDFIKLDEIKELRKTLALVKDASKTLETERAAAVASFLDSKNQLQLKASLRRVFVEEMVDNNKLFASCRKKLFDLYRIPADIADLVIIELREQVIKAKEAKVDFVPLMISAVKSYIKKTRVFDYLERGDEGTWSASLTKHGVLLLSGPPQCGKTFAARYHMRQLEKSAYEVGYGDDIGAAKRFLSLEVAAPRAYLLEDPFGALTMVEDARDRLKKLRQLIDEIGIDRKLIVTQRADILLEVFGAGGIADCAIDDIDWFNLDTNDTEFLRSAWLGFCADSSVSETIKNKVVAMLENGEHIEIGSLRHLASTAEKLSDRATDLEIMKAARPDAKDLAAELAPNRSSASLLSAFAFTTTQTMPVELADMEFILQDRASDHLPSYRHNQHIEYSFSADQETEDAPPPAYETGYQLNDEHQNLLDLLERRQYVEDAASVYNFTHPFYRAVGRAAVRSTTRSRKDDLLRSLRRAIYSLSGNTSSTTISSLDWILDDHSSDAELVQALISMAIDAFHRTLFVRTQQNCYRFLVNHLDRLTQKEKDMMPELSRTLSSVSLKEVKWVNSEAMFYWGGSQNGFQRYLRGQGTPVDEDTPLSFTERNSNKGEISGYLLGLSRKPHLLSIDGALNLLTYDESIIRAQVAKLWFMVNREDDHAVIKRILQDDQPNVLINALQSITEHIDRISDDRMSLIRSCLTDAFTSPLLCAAALYRIDLFSDDDEFGSYVKKGVEHWNLMASVIHPILLNAPDNVGVSSSRLAICITNTLRSAVSTGTKEAMLTAWIQWVEKKAALSLPLDDWILRAIEDVLIYMPRELPFRLELIRRYSALPGTSYRLVLMQELSRHWGDLSDNEQELARELATREAEDSSWVKAVLYLNTTPEVLTSILGFPYERKDFELDVLDTGSRDFHALVVLLFGLSPAAVKIGVGTAESRNWLDLSQQIARNPSHRFFTEAFEYLRGRHPEKFNDILLEAYKADKTKTLDRMWRVEADLNGLWNPLGWELLYHESEDPNERNLLVETLAEHVHKFIEAIDELPLCFGEELAEAIYAKTMDNALLSLLSTSVFVEALDSENAEGRATARYLLETLIEREICFVETYSLFENFVRKLSKPWNEFGDKLRETRIKAYEAASEARDRNSVNTRLSLDEERNLGWLST